MKTIPTPLNLSTVNPSGRLDCLAASLIHQIVSERVPELKPLLEQQREMVHASINSVLGPHVFDPEVVRTVAPLIPLGWRMLQAVRPVKAEGVDEPGGEGEKPK